MLIPPRDMSYTSNRLRSQVGKATRAGKVQHGRFGAMHHVVDDFRAQRKERFVTFQILEHSPHGIRICMDLLWQETSWLWENSDSKNAALITACGLFDQEEEEVVLLQPQN